MKQKELRKLIRERLRTGQLPPAFGAKTFGGRGRHTACDCCGQIISGHDIEYQVEFTAPLGEAGKTLRAHVECHWIWWEESGQVTRRGSPHALSRPWNAPAANIRRGGGPVN
jgi:hypothetical protein